MTLTIDIAPELESQIRDRAAQQGLDLPEYVVRALREHLSQTESRGPPHLAKAEARLLQEINVGPPEEVWHRYRALIQKRQAEMLAEAEQAELIAISDLLEELNARRLERLAELARMRNTSLTAVMEQLGIKAPPHA
ncbi:MAG: hypothetical protein HUU20_03665 [Pirellulales bacterium]|nr:hypothetical protein [Pirellulales bacterium]